MTGTCEGCLEEKVLVKDALRPRMRMCQPCAQRYIKAASRMLELFTAEGERKYGTS